MGYLVHGPKSGGDRWPEIPGPAWTDQEVQRYHDYRVTPAKELVEAACKITIERTGQTASSGAALPTLFKQAHAATEADAAGSLLGNGLVSTVQRLAELRNAVGTGHGRATSSEVPTRDARIAATAAVAVSEFLLNAA